MPTTVACHICSSTLSCRLIFTPNTVPTDIRIVVTDITGCTHVNPVQFITRSAHYSLEKKYMSDYLLG